ncbi:hypothetical protein BDV96DRAFT_318901 [Lophiotrema nucula]|uniref:Uncharacterized protein n=1 Tax=Lophiotrema nucula TaxID=690887 RepID=A0A6A5ZKC1_9PLEO|nr:hypothetical protein BDV96DRAFT_318901 [Lophiotrema nucula]
MSASSITTPRQWVSDPSSISALNRGPITSALALPTSCTQTLSLSRGDNAGSENLYFGHFANPYVDPACYPLGTLSSSQIAADSAWLQYFYSPAICPYGWTTAQTFSATFPAFGETNEISLGPETSAAICCPGGYSYKRGGRICQSSITQSQVISYVSGINNGAAGWDRGNTILSTFALSSSVIGDGVPILWQSSDKAVLKAAATMVTTPTATGAFTGSGTARTSPTSSLPSATSSSPSSPVSEVSSKGLSTGAKAGIGVGVSLVGIAIIALGIFLLLRRRRRNTPAPADTADGKIELNADLGSHPVQEVYSEAPELPVTVALQRTRNTVSPTYRQKID